MAADTIATSTQQPFPRRRARGTHGDLAARAAARTAPRGVGLATVIALPVHRADGPSVSEPEPELREGRIAALRVVSTPARPPRSAVRLIAALVTVGLIAAGVLSTVMATAEEPVVAGHVVLQPGETLWDVAVRSAPAGVDPRRQLDAVRRVNGFGPGALDAWTVVLIPAP